MLTLHILCGDGQKLYIPSIYDTFSTLPDIITENLSEQKIININTASQNELETLPGIGTSTAIKIIEYRKDNGYFKATEDIMNVPGIGESKYNVIKSLISI